MKLRVKFTKHGSIRYIGHLDVMRFFQKAIRRAQIDITYTTGFSPHQIMSFAQPLGVGLESNGEYMDIEVNSIISCRDVMERLNNASVPGIEVTSVKILPDNAINAMASVAAATYTVYFVEGRGPHFHIKEAIDALMQKDTVTITKQTKKGTREIDLKAGIFNLNWDDENNAVKMMVDASSAGNIKPVQIIGKIFNDNNETLKENALFVIREDTFTLIETEGVKKFISLDDVGHTDEP